MPWAARAAISASADPDSPQAIEARPNPAIPSMKIRRRP
jgi:hypothetical protein